jgi:hypothetical protein
MNRMTPREQLMLCVVMALLLAGWAVMAYRTAHPAVSVVSESVQN